MTTETSKNSTQPCRALAGSYLAYRVKENGFEEPSKDDWYNSQIYATAGVVNYGWAYEAEAACLIYVDYGGQVNICFRGTDGDGPCGAMTDWMTNLMCHLETMNFGGQDLQIHSGFHEELFGNNGEGTAKKDGIWKGIMHWVRHFDPDAERRINITGHSQGGALAFIAAAKLVQEKAKNNDRVYDNIKGVTTFAAPKPGALNFANYYNNVVLENREGKPTLGAVTIRYENTADLVPLLPPNLDFDPEDHEDFINWVFSFGINAAKGWLLTFRPDFHDTECRDFKVKFAEFLDNITLKELLKSFYPVGNQLNFIKFDGGIEKFHRKVYKKDEKLQDDSDITISLDVWLINAIKYLYGPDTNVESLKKHIESEDWPQVLQDISDIMQSPLENPLGQLAEAHTLQPGNGYMLAACPHEAFAQAEPPFPKSTQEAS